MDMKKIRLYHVLLLGYTVLDTDAVVTVTPHNTLSDGVSFEKGSEGIIMCTISSYTDYLTWEIDSSVAADCLPMCTVYSTVANYAFTFDTSNGIFNITINPVNDTDNGKVFLCDDGSDPASFTVIVKEKILPTGQIVNGSWCIVKNEEKWCYTIILTICILVAGMYVAEVVIVVIGVKNKRKKEESHAETETREIGEIEEKLNEKRADFHSKLNKSDRQWSEGIEQIEKKYRERIENEKSNLKTLRKTVETRETEWERNLTNESKLEYYRIKRTILDLQISQRQRIELEGEKELTRRKDEMNKGYQNQHSSTEKEMVLKLNQMRKEMSLSNEIEERKNNQSPNNELKRGESGMKLRRDIEKLEETYRTEIEQEEEELRKTIQHSTEGYHLERHSFKGKAKEMKLKQIHQETALLKNEKGEWKNRQSHNNELAGGENGMNLRRDIDKFEETFRTEIEEEELRKTIQHSTEEIQDNHAQKISKIRAMEEELNKRRSKLRAERGWRAKEENNMRKIEDDIRKLKQQRSEEGKDQNMLNKKRKRQDLEMKRKILGYQRLYIKCTLTREIAEFEDKYVRRKDVEDGHQRKRTIHDELREQLKQPSALREFEIKSLNRPTEYSVAELICEIENMAEKCDKMINEAEKRLEGEENSCLYYCLLFIPIIGLILLVSKICNGHKRRCRQQVDNARDQLDRNYPLVTEF